MSKSLPVNIQLFAEEGNENNQANNNESQENNQQGAENNSSQQNQENNQQADENNQNNANNENKSNQKDSKQLKDALRKSILKELGLDPNNKESISQVKQYIDSKKTEAEKAGERALEEKQKSDRLVKAEFSVIALQAGANKDYVEDICLLGLPKLDDSTTAEQVIADLKKRYDFWFKSSDNNSNANNGTGSSFKNGNNANSGDSKSNLGARLAAKSKNATGKFSYWGKK